MNFIEYIANINPLTTQETFMKIPILLSLACIITPLFAMQGFYIPWLPNDVANAIIIQLMQNDDYKTTEAHFKTLCCLNKQCNNLMNSREILAIIKNYFYNLMARFTGDKYFLMEFNAITNDMPLYLHCCIKTANDPNAFLLRKHRNEQGTPLHFAVRYGAKQCVRYLLRYEITDVNAKNIYGQTPLHCTMDHTSPDIVHILIKHGANINAKNNIGNTPLSLAVSTAASSNKIALALLEYETCDVNTKNCRKETPLHRALHHSINNKDIIEILVKKGASLNETNYMRRTPEQYILEHYGADYLSNLELLKPN